MTVLTVDDEKEIADLVELILKNEGYNVIKYYDSVKAYDEILKNSNIDLAVIDVMMPNMDGFELCAKIRDNYNYPIIMLTARVEDVDKITGLSIGADDYVTKPFNPLELLARVKAQLRRYKKYGASDEMTKCYYEKNGLLINKQQHTVTLFDKPVLLTPTEFDILWLLCENAGKVVSSEEIFQTVWKEDYLDSNNTVMVHIRRIREKLKEPSKNPRIIKTVWGVGYKVEKYAIKRYITYIFVYTVLYFLFVVVMDNLFDGVLLEFLYNNLYFRIFTLINTNRGAITYIFYAIGLVIISVLYILKCNKLIRMASESFLEEESKVLSDNCPAELRDFGQKLKDFKYTLKENETARILAEQQKNDLIVYLAHDLKTPLTSVIGYLSLLEETQDLPVEQRAKYVGIAIDKAYRLENLINEFFEITRLNLQTIEAQKSKVNLTVLLMQVLVEFYPMFEEKRLNIVHKVEPELTVHADADKLARVFDNLFRNAVNYSYEETDIVCTAYKTEKEVVIKVKNKGDDIPKEKLNRIFDKFYRADNSRRSATGGSGLGLAFAKQIVELHKGTITASCDDGNTEFTVILPL